MVKVIDKLCLSFGDTFLHKHTGAHTMAGTALQTSCIKYTLCVQIIIDHFNKYHEAALYVHLFTGNFFSLELLYDDVHFSISWFVYGS